MVRGEIKKLKENICKELKVDFDYVKVINKVYPKDDFKGNRKRIIKDDQTSFYYTVAQPFMGYQLFRYFLLSYSNTRKENARKYKCHECYRILIRDNGKPVACKLRTYSVYYNIKFDFTSYLHVVPFTKHFDDTWNFNPYKYGKIKKIKSLKYLDLSLKCLEKLNMKKNRSYYRGSITMLDLVQLYLKNPTLIETLQKLKRYDLISLYRNYLYDYPYEVMSCARHNYYPEKLDEYGHYVKNLKALEMDTKNPTILCPSNFMEANSNIEKKIQMKRDRERYLRDLEETKGCEEKYLKRVNKLLECDIGNDQFSIKILPSVHAFVEEGEKMHHCVFRMKYYLKEKSLVFSVRDRATNSRVETLELVISNEKHKDKLLINQCYGPFDKFTDHHKEIINLVNSTKSKVLQLIA